ncbi:MAG: hypothetical protein QF637_13495, partial [Acidimicrobiales bacterium]|jgi:spore coat polysaccharide biosynthesis protein SpsF|nr:hypothetical protein [Acidimicrobiales bacterium]
LLVEASERNITPVQREHVHRNFFDYGTQQAIDEDWAPVSTIQCPSSFSRPDIILDVNTDDQYQLMSKLYDELYSINTRFSIHDTIAWMDKYRNNN